MALRCNGCSGFFDEGARPPFDRLAVLYCTKCANDIKARWKRFLKDLKRRNSDHFLHSLFSNGFVARYYNTSFCCDLRIGFDPEYSFFKETLRETMPVWMLSARAAFGKKVFVLPLFNGHGVDVD